MAEKKSLSDIPPVEGISDVKVEVKDVRIPDREKNPIPVAEARPATAPEGYVYPTDAEYKSLLGIWIENKQPGQIQKGERYFQVISPDGYPVFVPLKTNLDQAYGSLSGRQI